MNYLTSTKHNPLVTDTVLLFIRMFIGFAMLSHGFPKLQLLLSGEEIKFYEIIGMSAKSSLVVAVFAEFVCSIFLILGLFSRIAIFFLVVTMAVAGLFVHSADVFKDRELSLLYLSVYLLILALGPGRFSVDAMISKRRESRW